LIQPFDGFASGTKIVLRIEDANLGPSKPNSYLAYSALRRAGKSPDGVFVYCGKGTAFPLKK
jgi:hypothetical protein